MTDLGNDYFIHDKARHEMVGERTGARYRLGDRLTVKVVRVDLETSRIDFTLVGAVDAPADAENDDAGGDEPQSASKKVRVSRPESATAKAAPAAWARSAGTATKPAAPASKSSRGKPASASTGKVAAGKSRSAKDKGRHSAQKNKGKPKAKAR